MPDLPAPPAAASTWRHAIAAAATAIAPHVQRTPLRRSALLSAAVGAEVWLKLECVQDTSSFKVRGAAAKLVACLSAARGQGVVVASSGNHGAACAHMAARLGCRITVALPENVAPAKLDAIRRLGAEVVQEGVDVAVTEAAGRQLAAQRGSLYVPPYNDARVVCGQGTIGVEVEDAMGAPDAILVPVGGGGLISGIAAWFADANTRVVGCQPSRSAVMAASVAAGSIVELASSPTLADGTAGGLEADAITFDLCRALVERYVLVEEDQIGAAMRELFAGEHLLVEGAGALGVAALLAEPERWRGRSVVVVISGGRVGHDDFTTVMAAR